MNFSPEDLKTWTEESSDGKPAISRTVGLSNFAEIRGYKRELLAEQESCWAAGTPIAPAELLKRWPTDPHEDSDVANVLFEDLMKRRALGEDLSVDEYSQQFPEHKRSLEGLISHRDFLNSIGVASSSPSCSLSFPEVGDELFGFRFRAELGRGAFARVFLAEQLELAGRPVAVKVSAIEGNEPQTLAQMQHTHIVPIYGMQEDQRSGLRAVCMPYFGGASLSRILQTLWNEKEVPVHGWQFANALECVQLPTGILPNTNASSSAKPNEKKTTASRTPLARLREESYVRAVAWIIARLAEGLQHAHQRGVFHRDIKPANILVGSDGQPMLLDFNLSQEENEDPAKAVLGGTIAYMAPEHLQAMSRRTPALIEQVDHRSDIYSLGMVLCEMLTGKKPFERSASYSVVPLQLEAMAVERSQGGISVRADRSDVPWGLESILRKCLAPKPADRYQQAEHLAEDLQCLLEDRPLQYAPELSRVEQITKWTRRHPRLTYAGSVSLVASVLLGLVGATLFAAQKHLVGTQEKLDVAQAQDRKRAFEAGALQALCLVNTTVGPQDHLPQGIQVCEETLTLYDLLADKPWQEPADWLRLPPEDRRKMAEDARELLGLLAAARVRLSPTDPAVLRQALQLVERGEKIPGLASSRALGMDRSRYLEWLGEISDAQAVKQNAEEIPVATAREHYWLASAQARNGTAQDYTRALGELDKALALDPRHYWSWMQRGICHMELGEGVLAAGNFGHCTGLWPDFAWGHFNLAYVQAQSGKLAESVVSYSRSLECDPKLIAARVNRGLICLELKRYSDALSDLDVALAPENSAVRKTTSGKNEGSLRASRAMALEGLKRFAEAEADFRLAFSQTSGETRLRLLWSYGFAVASRKPSEARKAFEEVLRDAPSNKEALYGLAMLAMDKGETTEAIRYFDKAIEAVPHFFDARRYRAVQLARNGNLQRASEDINWCLEKEPRNGASLYAAACVASLMSQKLAEPKFVNQAADFLEKALALGVGQDKMANDPDLAEIQAHPEIWQRIVQASKVRALRK